MDKMEINTNDNSADHTNDNTNNNNVVIHGTFATEFSFSHEVFGEKFYVTYVNVQRLSDSTDIIPVMISDRLIDISKNYSEDETYVVIYGQFRSYNLHENETSHLVLSVFAREINLIENPTSEDVPALPNSIFLDGYVCKKPVYRKTPLGREIADVLLAVNRPYGKSDYIPCICWGRNAKFADTFNVGDHIQITGRIQSRAYQKQSTFENKVAYEVSVSKLNKVEEVGAA